MTNENLTRLRSGWFPRPNAYWTWWVIADLIALYHIARSAIQRRPCA